MDTFGSATNAIRSLTTSPRTSPMLPQWYGSRSGGRSRRRSRSGRDAARVTSTRPRSRRARCGSSPSRRCSSPRSAASSGETSQNISGCSSASHGSQRDMPPAVWCSVSRKVVSTYGNRAVVARPRDTGCRAARHSSRAGLHCCAVQRVLDHRLLRLVVRRQRAVDDAARREEPALAVGLHDERRRRRRWSSMPCRVGRRPVRRRPVDDEVRHVVAGPLAACASSHQTYFLRSRPRLAVGVGRGAVVEDAAVGRPRPAPLRRDPALLATRGLRRAVWFTPSCVAAGVDPAAARGRAVVLQLGEAVDRLAGRRPS